MPITHNQAWESSSSKGNGSVLASCTGMQMRQEADAGAQCIILGKEGLIKILLCLNIDNYKINK